MSRKQKERRHPIFRLTYNQRRPTSSTSTTTSDPTKILAEQRLKRPVSPHLAIYRPQITWYASALHRITGSVASGGLYVFGAAYLIAPLFGWHLESASIAAAFGAMPFAATSPGGIRVRSDWIVMA